MFERGAEAHRRLKPQRRSNNYWKPRKLREAVRLAIRVRPARGARRTNRADGFRAPIEIIPTTT
jgi:hypothetical protein